MQAIYKNARGKGFLKAKEKKKIKAPVKHRLIKKLIALSLLKPTDIPVGYSEVKQEFMDEFPIESRKFLEYYELQWLRCPEIFSVYRCPVRTNNVLESYHRTLNGAVKKNPTARKFFGQ